MEKQYDDPISDNACIGYRAKTTRNILNVRRLGSIWDPNGRLKGVSLSAADKFKPVVNMAKFEDPDDWMARMINGRQDIDDKQDPDKL